MALHLVRVSQMGEVGRFTAVDGRQYPRGARVIVRTPRGLETGEVLATFDGHRGGVSALAFSPDGTRLASGGHDGMTLVWDVAGK